MSDDRFAEFDLQYRSLVESKGKVSEDERVRRFFAVAWEHQMAENPEWATSLGHPGYDDRWRDWSLGSFQVRADVRRSQLGVLHSIDRQALGASDQLSYDLFKREREEEIESLGYRPELMPMNQLEGVHQDLPRFLLMMPLHARNQRDNAISRLERIPKAVSEVLGLMREGVKIGLTPPRVCLGELGQQIANQITADPSAAPILAFLSQLPASLAPGETKNFIDECHRVYTDKIVPSLRTLHEFVTREYLPACRQTDGWSKLPRGREWYEFLVRRHTTTSMTPEDVFQTGISEVKRLRAAMDEIIRVSGFTGDFSAFCEFLRTDARFFFTEAADLLRAYRDISKRVDPELVRLFGRLPRLPYGVIPIPSYAEKSQTTAYYEPGSYQAGRPGYFYANTYDLASRPQWEMEALTLHEAVPGHHLQIALAQELNQLPEFRRHSWITSYGEGWALYAESLGEEMGFYADPYAKFGQLTYQMWRAVRLVVDTGLHAKGWSRQQAIDFFRSNSSKAEHDIAVEIDRYMVWPGQALAYKIGELRIKALRDNASKELADKFDLRSFHDELLSEGCLPLDVLERRMSAWIEIQKRKLR